MQIGPGPDEARPAELKAPVEIRPDFASDLAVYAAPEGGSFPSHGPKRLLSLAGRGGGGGGCPDATTAGHSCLGDKLEGALRSDMGEGLYDRLVAGYRKEYRLGTRDLKKPLVTHLLMREIERRRIRPARPGRIVGAILAGDAAGGRCPA